MIRRFRQLLVTALSSAAVPLFATQAQAADATVDLTATKQLIRGYGASSAWCGTVSTSIMDALYKDLGYSILRVRIEESIGDAWTSGNFSAWKPELTNAQNAIARGAIVFASPWNPPASMKSGGKLITTKYADYANYLKAYVKYFADNKAPLHAVSIQNEPDYATDWTAWTATDLLNFLKAEGAGLAAATKVMMPESFQFRHPMSDPSLNDATAASYISIIGGHLYGGTIQTYPLATDQGKELWETEHYFDTDGIADIMSLGKEVHSCMVTASMNAYVYWWITWPNGLANSNGTIFKRAYALGQWAKYVRPGYHRVDATASPATNVNVSAYTGDNKLVIVAVNSGTAAVSQNFVVRGGTATQVSSSQTSASANMTAGQDYSISNGAFTASLAAQSITTFVGSVSGTSVGGSSSTGGASSTGGSSSTGGRISTGGSSTSVVQTGGSTSTGGGAAVGGGSVVVATGGRVATGGAVGVGGASVVAETGGRVATGGNISSGGQVGAEDVSITPPTGESSGCGCVVAGTSRHGAGGAIGALLGLSILTLRRRRVGT